MVDIFDKPLKASLRLRGYDYSQAGYYYVTICTEECRCFFGDIIEGNVHLNDSGKIVQAVWDDLPRRFPGVTLDEYIIMPNHMHGIIVQSGEPMATKVAPELGKIIRAFKAVSAHKIRTSSQPGFTWQHDFYDHIIRRNGELDRIRAYIVDNPMRWSISHDNHQE